MLYFKCILPRYPEVLGFLVGYQPQASYYALPTGVRRLLQTPRPITTAAAPFLVQLNYILVHTLSLPGSPQQAHCLRQHMWHRFAKP